MEKCLICARHLLRRVGTSLAPTTSMTLRSSRPFLERWLRKLMVKKLICGVLFLQVAVPLTFLQPSCGDHRQALPVPLTFLQPSCGDHRQALPVPRSHLHSHGMEVRRRTLIEQTTSHTWPDTLAQHSEKKGQGSESARMILSCQWRDHQTVDLNAATILFDRTVKMAPSFKSFC